MNTRRRFTGGEIPTSSMADIAFLLLIFFLVTTTIDMDKGLGMVLPAEGEELEINKKNILNCLINSTGNVLLGGEPVEVRNLSKVVRQKIAENDKHSYKQFGNSVNVSNVKSVMKMTFESLLPLGASLAYLDLQANEL